MLDCESGCLMKMWRPAVPVLKWFGRGQSQGGRDFSWKKLQRRWISHRTRQYDKIGPLRLWLWLYQVLCDFPLWRRWKGEEDWGSGFGWSQRSKDEQIPQSRGLAGSRIQIPTARNSDLAPAQNWVVSCLCLNSFDLSMYKILKIGASLPLALEYWPATVLWVAVIMYLDFVVDHDGEQLTLSNQHTG